MKHKKFNSIVLTILIALSTLTIQPTKALASESSTFSASFSGIYDDSDSAMDFDIYSIDKENQTFSGHIMIDYYADTLNQDVSGKISLNEDNYVCEFTFKYVCWFVKYDATFTLTINPFTGVVTGLGGGGALIYSTSIYLTGTKDKFYNKYLSYSETDFKMCMALSNEMYGMQKDKQVATNIKNLVDDNFEKVTSNEITVKNYTDDKNPDNVAFAMLNRKNESSIDIIVSIRGSYNEEWQGNVQLTGAAYSASQLVHENFNKAKESIKNDIIDYCNQYAKDYDKVNLIITGHSRGAAVANLYAKEAVDVSNSKESKNNIPLFDTVTAYTFASPNVEKIEANKSAQKMENYTSIYNFWFNTDIVPTVPLTSPTDGWNYWKYGRCFTKDISNGEYRIDIIKNWGIYISGQINRDIVEQLALPFSQWKSVEDYYNKELYKSDKPGEHLTLYSFCTL